MVEGLGSGREAAGSRRGSAGSVQATARMYGLERRGRMPEGSPGSLGEVERLQARAQAALDASGVELVELDERESAPPTPAAQQLTRGAAQSQALRLAPQSTCTQDTARGAGSRTGARATASGCPRRRRPATACASIPSSAVPRRLAAGRSAG